MSRVAAALRHVTYARYMAASAVALGLDGLVFLLFLAAPLPAAMAAIPGYVAGVAAQWWLSSRAVFADRVADAGPDRVTQQALFLGSAGAGLALTVGIVGFAASLGVHPLIAKGIAIAVSFHATWLLRRHIVFA